MDHKARLHEYGIDGNAYTNIPQCQGKDDDGGKKERRKVYKGDVT
jgi:hypothetical protein